jgi:hypothetical protein
MDPPPSSTNQSYLCIDPLFNQTMCTSRKQTKGRYSFLKANCSRVGYNEDAEELAEVLEGGHRLNNKCPCIGEFCFSCNCEAQCVDKNKDPSCEQLAQSIGSKSIVCRDVRRKKISSDPSSLSLFLSLFLSFFLSFSSPLLSSPLLSSLSPATFYPS